MAVRKDRSSQVQELNLSVVLVSFYRVPGGPQWTNVRGNVRAVEWGKCPGARSFTQGRTDFSQKKGETK